MTDYIFANSPGYTYAATPEYTFSNILNTHELTYFNARFFRQNYLAHKTPTVLNNSSYFYTKYFSKSLLNQRHFRVFSTRIVPGIHTISKALTKYNAEVTVKTVFLSANIITTATPKPNKHGTVIIRENATIKQLYSI